MARNLGSVRFSSVAQIVLAGLLVIFGILDRLIAQTYQSSMFNGVWIGLWVLITGCLGFLASREGRPLNWALVWSYMGFSITAACFCGSIIVNYSILLAYFPYRYYSYGFEYMEYEDSTRMAITAIVLVLGIVEFGVGIWSSVSCCVLQGCSCCQTTSQLGESNQGGFPAGVASVYMGTESQAQVQSQTIPTSAVMAVPVQQVTPQMVAVQMSA